MTEKAAKVRVLAVVPADMQNRIRQQLAPLNLRIDFVDKGSGWSHRALSKTTYQVALVPAVLPEADWWSLWGEIALLDPRPEIVVYAQAANFTLWSGVLEMGGFDLIVQPFTDSVLQGAILRAAQSFAQGHREQTSDQ